jgi:mannose-1-phosphate guanylyltransferase/mannose-6-phosphate isomerase
MFVFKAGTYLKALQQLAPDMYAACVAVFTEAAKDQDFIRLDEKLFKACPSDSIDYAVMEKAENTMMVPLQSDWSDIGSWSALWSVSDKDYQGNVVVGDVVAVDCENCLFDSHDRLIAAVGVRDIVVVETNDAIMVAHRDKAQQVKDIVEALDSSARSEHLLHREVHRPWGAYDSLEQGETHQVKHITVKPGASISLQLHHHRSEHWVVVKGKALVQLGDEQHHLEANQSIGIPVKTKHRLTNVGDELLHLIEVQCGDYLGEDDIVRFDDIYGRGTKVG